MSTFSHRLECLGTDKVNFYNSWYVFVYHSKMTLTFYCVWNEFVFHLWVVTNDVSDSIFFPPSPVGELSYEPCIPHGLHIVNGCSCKRPSHFRFIYHIRMSTKMLTVGQNLHLFLASVTLLVLSLTCVSNKWFFIAVVSFASSEDGLCPTMHVKKSLLIQLEGYSRVCLMVCSFCSHIGFY